MSISLPDTLVLKELCQPCTTLSMSHDSCMPRVIYARMSINMLNLLIKHKMHHDSLSSLCLHDNVDGFDYTILYRTHRQQAHTHL